MTDRDLSTRIGRLNEEERKEFDEKVESKEEDLEEKLFDEYRQKVSNEINTNREETDDFNIIISAFEERDGIDYTYIRTEPLFHEKEHNLDVLVASQSKQIALFVECERRLTSRLLSKLMNFDEKIEVIEDNLADNVDIDQYLKQTIGVLPKMNEFVMASRQIPEMEIHYKAQEVGRNVITWNLATPGNKCQIYQKVFKKAEDAPFTGHNDDELNDYINNELEKGVPYQQYIDFTYSSSWYLKLRDMVVTIINQHHRQGHDNFDYEEWRELFQYELKNYQREECLMMYNKFLDYGIDCGLVSLEEDAEDDLQKRYRIIHSVKRDQEKLIQNIVDKIAEQEMQTEFNSLMREFKEQLLTQMERNKATGGRTLSDFVDPEE
ncbi:hypothetical protein DQW50_09235 [Halorubrum sp. 48-1-W]|uniref:hypothetical protein n=1 Tax=Halorubrum sp. 48-1-W TaxID=2249761 RepID=UPI000DCDC5EF|nr:hypothetical protein [Halorubrum sp. 48-1-W]RAW45322.1 hypothetical protein DQW50_09235 [Halorubrum sp. 48-1-W]